MQGMQAHVGVAGVQDNGAAALWFLAASGTLWHYIVVALCGAWWRGGVALSATCTRVMQCHRHGLSPTRATVAACGGGVLGHGHAGALTDLALGWRRGRSCQPSDHRGGRRRGGDRAGHPGACRRGGGARAGSRGAGKLGRERCVVAPLVVALWGVWCMTGRHWWACFAGWRHTICYVHVFDAASPPRLITHVNTCFRVWWWWSAGPWPCGCTA